MNAYVKPTSGEDTERDDGVPADVRRQIERDCFEEVREVVGPGFTADYMQSYASGFVQITLAWYRRGAYRGEPRNRRACPTVTPEPHELGEFPMTCYRCHVEADS